MEYYQFATIAQRRAGRAKFERLAAGLGAGLTSHTLTQDEYETLSVEKEGYVAMLTIHKHPVHGDNTILVHWHATTFSEVRFPRDFLLGRGGTRVNDATFRKATTFAHDFEQALAFIREGFAEVLPEASVA